MNNCRVCKASIAGLGWAWDKASQQQATGQPASQPACLCVPVGWAGNVSESIRFRTKSNTLLAAYLVRICVSEHEHARPSNMIMPVAESRGLIPPSFCLSVRVFDVLSCPLESVRLHSPPSGLRSDILLTLPSPHRSRM